MSDVLGNGIYREELGRKLLHDKKRMKKVGVGNYLI